MIAFIILFVLGCISCTDNRTSDAHSAPIIEDEHIVKRVQYTDGIRDLDDVQTLLPDPIAAQLPNDSQKIIPKSWVNATLKNHFTAFVQAKRAWRQNPTQENRAVFLKQLHAMRRHIIRLWANKLWHTHNYTMCPTPFSVLHKSASPSQDTQGPITSERSFVKEVVNVFRNTAGSSGTDTLALSDLEKSCKKFWAEKREQDARTIFTTQAPLLQAQDLKHRVNMITGLHARPHLLDDLSSIINNPVAKNTQGPPLGHSTHMRIVRQKLWPSVDADLMDLLKQQTARDKALADADKTLFFRALQKVRQNIVYMWASGYWDKHNATGDHVPFHTLALKARLWPLEEGAPPFKLVTTAAEFAKAMQWVFERTCGTYGANIDAIASMYRHTSQFLNLSYRNHTEESAKVQCCDKPRCSCLYNRSRFIQPLRPDVLGKTAQTVTPKALENIRSCLVALMTQPLELVRLHALTYNPLACRSILLFLHLEPYTGYNVPPTAPPAILTPWWSPMKKSLIELSKHHAKDTPFILKNPDLRFMNTPKHKELRKRIVGLWALALWERYNTLNKPSPFGPYEILTKEKFKEAVENFFEKESKEETFKDAFITYKETIKTIIQRGMKCVDLWSKAYKKPSANKH